MPQPLDDMLPRRPVLYLVLMDTGERDDNGSGEAARVRDEITAALLDSGDIARTFEAKQVPSQTGNVRRVYWQHSMLLLDGKLCWIEVWRSWLRRSMRFNCPRRRKDGCGRWSGRKGVRPRASPGPAFCSR